jgi:hypothetical protein
MRGMITIAAILVFNVVLGSPAQAQQQQWGRDNCLYTWTNNGWVRVPACRYFVQGNPAVFVMYNGSDRQRRPIARIDMRAADWIYLYSYDQRITIRYPNRGVWNPPPSDYDYQVWSMGHWVQRERFAAGQGPNAGNQGASQLQTQQLMQQLFRAGHTNSSQPTPLPSCSLLSNGKCSDAH